MRELRQMLGALVLEIGALLPHLEIEVGLHTEVADDRGRPQARAVDDRWARAIEIAVEHEVVALAAGGLHAVAHHDRDAVEIADEDDLRFADLVLQIDQRDDRIFVAVDFDAEPDRRGGIRLRGQIGKRHLVVRIERQLVRLEGLRSIGHPRNQIVRRVGAQERGGRRCGGHAAGATSAFERRLGRGQRQAALAAVFDETDVAFGTGERLMIELRRSSHFGAVDRRHRRRLRRTVSRRPVLRPRAAQRGEERYGAAAFDQCVHQGKLLRKLTRSQGRSTSSHVTEEATLEGLFEAERRVRELLDELAGRGREAMMGTISAAIVAAADEEPSEAAVRLVCLSRLLGEFDGADVADALIDILGSDEVEARREAGEQLQGLAYDRFREVADAVERALERLGEGSHALVELPYILVEIPEGGVVRLLKAFLEHGDGDVVAAAIEALVEIGDPSAAGALEALKDDQRICTVDEPEDAAALGTGEVMVGDLASEAIELLSGNA